MKTEASESNIPTVTKHSTKFQNLTGEVFGRLTVLSRAPNRGDRTCWNCRCSCGTEKTVISKVLKNGDTVSCGCYGLERKIATNTIHGQAAALAGRPKGTNTYAIWMAMMSRCNNRNVKRYSDYGGRGVKPCSEMATFVGFFRTMGDRPSGLTIDRVDNDSGYFCGTCSECVLHNRIKNVRWSTQVVQNNNRRNNHLITHNGKTQSISMWATELGMNPIALRRKVVVQHLTMAQIVVSRPVPQ